jgi:hypothetical protein
MRNSNVIPLQPDGPDEETVDTFESSSSTSGMENSYDRIATQ